MLVDKVNETLESILKAYEKCLIADMTIPPKLKEDPSPPIQEKINLVKHQGLIRDTQTMLKGPSPYSTERLPMYVPNLEKIPKDSKQGMERDRVV